MTAEQEAKCAAVPLVELLEHIPADARYSWTDTDGLRATHYMPIGRYAHEAAHRLRSLEAELDREAAAHMVTERNACDLAEQLNRMSAEIASLRRDAARGKYLISLARPIETQDFFNRSNVEVRVVTAIYWPENFREHVERTIDAALRSPGEQGET